MQIQFSIVEKSEKKQWLKFSRSSFREEEFQTVVFYIGNNEIPSVFADSNCYQISVADLEDAFRRIKSSRLSITGNYPKIIVIDIPATIAELEKFSLFIKKEMSCLLLCNNKILSKSETKFLLDFDLIDAAIEISSSDLDKLIKTALLKKEEKLRERIYLQAKSFKSSGKDKARDFSFLLKKMFDIAVTSVIILVLLPVFILIAIAIRLDSKGPIVYSSNRAGRGYKIFKFYKFRSMVVDADKKMQQLSHLNQYSINGSGPQFFKLSNDPRVTRVGKFLRNTSLDELPQLFNVLKGDMSLVGNRPLPLYEAATLTTNEFVERFTAPAGMTGYWQIKKRGKAEMSIKERMDLDIHYARKANPLFDLYIMASTPAALFQKSDV